MKHKDDEGNKTGIFLCKESRRLVEAGDGVRVDSSSRSCPPDKGGTAGAVTGRSLDGGSQRGFPSVGRGLNQGGTTCALRARPSYGGDGRFVVRIPLPGQGTKRTNFIRRFSA